MDAEPISPTEPAGIPCPDDSKQTAKTKRSRFWLLLIGLLVLLLLVSPILLGLYSYSVCYSDSGVSKPKEDIKTLEALITRYKTDMGVKPKRLLDLSVRPTDTKGPWRKMLQEAALKDPWGNDYRYINPGKHNKDGYDLFSLGPDGKEGTEDDIGNWSN